MSPREAGTTETTFLAAIAASKATYVLSLHESSAVGIAAGYALITGKPSIVSLHTYPGLANGVFNMRNALMAGVPLFVINGQQDSRFLTHNPVLGAPNTRLAETATKYSYEVTSIDDLAVALQRCYLQARLQPTGPVFLSIPMNFMLERTEHATFKKTRIIEDAVPRAGRCSCSATASTSSSVKPHKPMQSSSVIMDLVRRASKVSAIVSPTRPARLIQVKVKISGAIHSACY